MDGMNGQVINLISNDVATLDYATCFFQELWVGPVEAIIMGYFIYREIKFYGLIGIGVMLLFIPLQGRPLTLVFCIAGDAELRRLLATPLTC